MATIPGELVGASKITFVETQKRVVTFLFVWILCRRFIYILNDNMATSKPTSMALFQLVKQLYGSSNVRFNPSLPHRCNAEIGAYCCPIVSRHKGRAWEVRAWAVIPHCYCCTIPHCYCCTIEARIPSSTARNSHDRVEHVTESLASITNISDLVKRSLRTLWTLIITNQVSPIAGLYFKMIL